MRLVRSVAVAGIGWAVLSGSAAAIAASPRLVHRFLQIEASPDGAFVA
jgi:hypothetical protein